MSESSSNELPPLETSEQTQNNFKWVAAGKKLMAHNKIQKERLIELERREAERVRTVMMTLVLHKTVKVNFGIQISKVWNRSKLKQR